MGESWGWRDGGVDSGTTVKLGKRLLFEAASFFVLLLGLGSLNSQLEGTLVRYFAKFPLFEVLVGTTVPYFDVFP
ncbi:hypothetical protein PAENIP36_12450 [Paenibacillus sp. P36]